jgi:2-oxoisovalerate dehydrogenase E1 component
MSDDERMYRPAAEREEQEERDPLTRTRSLILELGVAGEEELTRLEVEAEAEVGHAAQEAVTHPQPDPSSVLDHLYSDSVDPTGPAFDTESTPSYEEGSPLLTMVDLLNACIREEMDRDPRIVVFGEDVADASREEALAEVKGKGGVFKVSRRRSEASACSTPPWQKPTSSAAPLEWRSGA